MAGKKDKSQLELLEQSDLDPRCLVRHIYPNT